MLFTQSFDAAQHFTLIVLKVTATFAAFIIEASSSRYLNFFTKEETKKTYRA